MPVNVLDIKSDRWVGLILRLQRLGNTQYIGKCKIIRLSVVCGEDGQPVVWSEPECTPIEPGHSAKAWLNSL